MFLYMFLIAAFENSNSLFLYLIVIGNMAVCKHRWISLHWGLGYPTLTIVRPLYVQTQTQSYPHRYYFFYAMNNVFIWSFHQYYTNEYTCTTKALLLISMLQGEILGCRRRSYPSRFEFGQSSSSSAQRRVHSF